jgi:hypothetical protein
MSRDRLIIIGVVVLAALGYFVWKQADKDKKLGTTGPVAASSADYPVISSPDDIDGVVIKDGKKDEIVLEKKDDKWVLTKPVSAPANQQSVKEIVTNLGTLKVKEQVVINLDDEVKKAKKLDADQALHVQAFKGSEKKTDISAGITGALGQLVMVAGKDGLVYATSGFSSYLYTKEAKDWRDKEILKFDEANVVSMTIDNKVGDAGAASFSFTKGEKEWGASYNGKPIARFDEQRAKDLLKEMHAVNAEDFGDGKAASDTGLDAPEGTITISFKDNAPKIVLKIGKPSSNPTSRYAMKDGNPTVFVIGKPQADWILAELGKFQRPLDAGAPDAGGKDSGGAPKPMAIPGMPPGMQMPQGMPPGHP